MATNFPTSIDSLSNPQGTDTMNTVSHSTQHANANDAIEAIEAYLGTSGSTDPNTITGKLVTINPLTTKGDIFVRSATGNNRLPVGANGQMIVADSNEPTGLKYINPSSGGTVTSVSVVNANGLTGSVANPTTSPAITLSTTVTGLLKGNGTAISPATAGNDYYAPNGADVPVADGGTGVSSLTPYAPIFGGTTGTGPVQSGTLGTAGQVLTSNGPGAIPTMQDTLNGRTTAQLAMAIPLNLTTNNTTIYGTTVTISAGLVFWSFIVNSQGSDQSGTVFVQWSPDNTNWVTIGATTAFASFANNFNETKGPIYGASIMKSGFLRTGITSAGVSINSISTTGSYVNY